MKLNSLQTELEPETSQREHPLGKALCSVKNLLLEHPWQEAEGVAVRGAGHRHCLDFQHSLCLAVGRVFSAELPDFSGQAALAGHFCLLIFYVGARNFFLERILSGKKRMIRFPIQRKGTKITMLGKFLPVAGLRWVV